MLRTHSKRTQTGLNSIHGMLGHVIMCVFYLCRCSMKLCDQSSDQNRKKDANGSVLFCRNFAASQILSDVSVLANIVPPLHNTNLFAAVRFSSMFPSKVQTWREILLWTLQESLLPESWLIYSFLFTWFDYIIFFSFLKEDILDMENMRTIECALLTRVSWDFKPYFR